MAHNPTKRKKYNTIQRDKANKNKQDKNKIKNKMANPVNTQTYINKTHKQLQLHYTRSYMVNMTNNYEAPYLDTENTCSLYPRR